MTQATKHFRKRDAILSYLRSTDVHPSADMVYAHLKPEIPDLSLGTVYRNLSMFRQQGTIASVGTVNGVERFDGNTMPHVHFICTDCSAVIDMPQLQVPENMTRSAECQLGGRVAGCSLTFTGQCRECIRNIKGGETA
ncbi:MAG: transcriptional repressor [Oscillospiraceae bacterium]|nr:transcriptional repressor [Oscillospiraceae bacterium]